MAASISEVIKQVEAATGRRQVCAVVTDNASNMKSAWKKWKEISPALICNGCAAHTLNLLLQDMFRIEIFNSVRNTAVAITKFCRKRPALLYHFREKQRSLMGSCRRRFALKLPLATRWYSTVTCVSNVVRNQSVLIEVFDNSRTAYTIRKRPGEARPREVCFGKQ